VERDKKVAKDFFFFDARERSFEFEAKSMVERDEELRVEGRGRRWGESGWSEWGVVFDLKWCGR